MYVSFAVHAYPVGKLPEDTPLIEYDELRVPYRVSRKSAPFRARHLDGFSKPGVFPLRRNEKVGPEALIETIHPIDIGDKNTDSNIRRPAFLIGSHLRVIAAQVAGPAGLLCECPGTTKLQAKARAAIQATRPSEIVANSKRKRARQNNRSTIF
jgi:hypothetical protein